MYARTLYIGSPAYLSCSLNQLKLSVESENGTSESKRPIEDLGYLILDHPQIHISQVAIQQLIQNQVAIIYCDDRHMPTAMIYPFQSHHTQNKRVRAQFNNLNELKDQLWQQTISSKLFNQARLLELLELNPVPLLRWSKKVSVGDTENLEARGSKYYWRYLFSSIRSDFKRNRDGLPPNNLLNYGYAILRSVVSRAICCAGLMPQIGIHHHNKYNAFCLADDLMEPYRPFVDLLVLDAIEEFGEVPGELDKHHKAYLLQLLQMDCKMGKKTRPLLHAIQSSATCLAKCFEKERSTLKYGKISTA